jgi:hypothetical protein
MSTTSFLPTLAAISAQVTVLNEHTYRLRDQELPVTHQQSYTKWHQPLHHFGQNSGDESQCRSNLQQQLAQALYGTFYCAGSTEPGPAPLVGQPLPPQAEREQHMARLSAANSTADGFDPQWTVYSVDSYGNAFVSKNGQLRQLMPKQWEFMNADETSLQVGAVVRLRISREDKTVQPVFYHVRGTELVSQQAEFVRIYFNTTFDGAELLVREITRTFNHYRLPFMFKCLNHPGLFTRTDSAVLYLSKFDLRFASRLLRPILDKLTPHLKPEVPLFTKMLRPGVSFSEDPGNGQSFGMSRCTLLAEAIVGAYYKQMGAGEGQLAEIRRTFDRNGLDVEHLYRNPNSHLSYPFAALAAELSPAHD